MTPKPNKAEELVDLFMASATDDLLDGGPAGVRQALLAFVLTGRVKRELVSHPHPLAEDADPRKIEYAFTIRRDETAEEKATREANAEKRIAVAMWTLHHEGPPPKGVGFMQLMGQRVWWAPREGDPVKIVDMDLSHRKNLLAYLERNAASLKLSAEWALLSSLPDSPSDGVADALDGIMGEMEATTDSNWIRKQPLVKALRKSIKRDEEKAAAR